MMDGWRVALLYNLKDNVAVSNTDVSDALAEYDSVDTIQALENALLDGGHRVISLEADETLVDTIRQANVDICFNIAEGQRGEARESQVPALLEMLGIPYTGSKVLAHALSLDKAAAKRVWRDCGLPTTPFQVFRRGDECLERGLDFPLFVKPVREGSGMGINGRSVVWDEAGLRAQVRWVIHSYKQPALVEAFLPGQEFTVGVLGNRTMPWEQAPSLYDERGYHVFPVLEIDVSPLREAEGLYNSYAKTERPLDLDYLCPALIEDGLTEDLQGLAVHAFEAIGALDVARVDFRLGSDGMPYLMEINTLPGLNPTYSDIVIAARAEGMAYRVLVNEILNLAVDRYGLVWDRGFAPRVPLRSLQEG
jgi:D-alanine-D-alanine ligase